MDAQLKRGFKPKCSLPCICKRINIFAVLWNAYIRKIQTIFNIFNNPISIVPVIQLILIVMFMFKIWIAIYCLCSQVQSIHVIKTTSWYVDGFGIENRRSIIISGPLFLLIFINLYYRCSSAFPILVVVFVIGVYFNNLPFGVNRFQCSLNLCLNLQLLLDRRASRRSTLLPWPSPPPSMQRWQHQRALMSVLWPSLPARSELRLLVSHLIRFVPWLKENRGQIKVGCCFRSWITQCVARLCFVNQQRVIKERSLVPFSNYVYFNWNIKVAIFWKWREAANHDELTSTNKQ